METITVHILCSSDGAQPRPVAVSARRPPHPATPLQVERESVALGHLFVLYRGGRTCKVISGSARRERVEGLRARLTRNAAAYAIARIPFISA